MSEIHSDVILIGAGVMSATLGVLLKELQPDLTITILESLDEVAGESSDALNNAGTGHAALCELNYTPARPDGSIDISKALDINESFEESKQFWSYLIQQGVIPSATSFLHQVPHMSFVRGEANVSYLKKRYEALAGNHCFKGMEFSTSPEELKEWIPLVMEGRNPREAVAATRMGIGTDVNFGALTRHLVAHLAKQSGVALYLGHKVTNVHRRNSKAWKITAADKSGQSKKFAGKFVFLGAGGGALPLLQKSGIPEGKGFGGFPVSGQWLACDNPAVVERHHAKVYGKASVGSPPMSVPHLDTRIIDGKKTLLFGPYAGFSTRFLKSGSLLDMPKSITLDNVIPMLAAGKDNIDLTRYLIGQVLQSSDQRLDALREFMPKAADADWKLAVAGQRVQIIKKTPGRGGVLQFGTEVVSAADGSIAALLGASPGASTSVSIMLQLIRRCFKESFDSAEWQEKLHRMIPSEGESLATNLAFYQRTRAWTSEVLGLRNDITTVH